MNVIPLIISILLLILTACAPTTPGMPINGSDQMETLVVENTVADISTPVQPTLTPILLVPMMGNPTATSPAGDIPERITFAPGSTIATVTGSLPASGSDRYVLRAFAGQTMNVNLTFSEGRAILVVWGADGTVILTDHAEVSSFQGVLPATQDYYVRVRGRPGGSTTYSMTVSLPPLP